MKKILTGSLAALTIGATMLPSFAGAQSWHRQDQKDQWKDIAIGAGALGVIGALTHNDALTFGGLAGAVYAAYRYDADGRCYGERYDSRRHTYNWVRVPDRDRNNDYGYGNGGYDNSRYDNSRYDNSRYDNSRYDNGRDWNRHDNGNHNGWDKGRKNGWNKSRDRDRDGDRD